MKIINKYLIFQFLFSMSLFVYFQYIPRILDNFGWKVIEIGIFNSLEIIVFILLGIHIKKLIKNIRKIKIIKIGIIILILDKILLYLVIDKIILSLIIQAIDSIIFLLLTIIGFDILSKISEENKTGQRSGQLLTYSMVGALIGIQIGNILLKKELYAELFIASAIILMINLILFQIISKNKDIKKIDKIETNKEGIKKNKKKEIKKILKKKEFKITAIIAILVLSAQEIFNLIIPLFIIKNLNYSQDFLNIILSIPIIFLILQSQIGKIIDKFKIKSPIILSCFFVGIGILGISIFKKEILLILSVITYGLSKAIWNVSTVINLQRIGKKIKDIENTYGAYYSISRIGVLIPFLYTSYLAEFIQMEIIFKTLGTILIIVPILLKVNGRIKK